ncbi:ABC transporter permease [Clostridium sp. CM028]|uniref:ABC transporter permease n=1 Tax=Clostridium sp. CM028 TaxID=2851575 RepID=UPI001C6E83F4|nr:ABC transporter permease [Clostridium sp. CM028]MBW9147773.1 ABC transporter permease [Clostridium sp. CM028]WLC61218.1 ABC transporter permease [Clostridium sp. CM028]
MLFLKMIRDMKLNKTQFISIFIMSILGVFIYVGINSEWYGLQTASNEYYRDTNFANVWIYGSGFTKSDADKVLSVNGVTSVQRRLTIDSVARFENKPKITLHFTNENKISKCQLIDGQEFSVDKDGVWLDDAFAKAKGLTLGDTISTTFNGITMKKEILGTVLNPEYVYATGDNDIVPNHENFGFAYLSDKSLPKSIPIFYTDLLVTTDGTDYSKLEKKIDTALDGKYSVFLTRNNFGSYAMFQEEIEQHKAIGQVFPIVFLAIALLTIITTMTRLVNNQRTQIGTLKAIGFKKKHILFHYVSYGLWISIAGAVIGLVAGPLILPHLFYDSLKTAYTLPVWKPEVSVSSFIMALVSVIACTLATYLTCRKVLKDIPSQLLLPKAPRIMKQGFFEKTKLWAKIGFNTQWNLRDMFRSKVRSIMAIIGVMGCTSLLVCAFGMKDSVKDVISWQYSDINHYETKLTLSEKVSKKEISSIKNSYAGESIMEGTIEIKAKDKKKTAQLLVTENVTLINPQNAKREAIQLPQDKVSISYKMANLLGVKVGDEISFHIYGDERYVTSTIGAIYRTPISQGITLTKNNFERLGYNFKATSIITSKKINSNVTGVTRIWSRVDLTKSYETMTEAMNIMVYILILGAAILGIVVLYNLGILSFTERQRELATLKVLGFKTKRIRWLLLTQTIWITTLGIIIGIPCGKWLISYMISFMGDTFDMMTIISVQSLFYSIFGTILISILVNLMFSKKVKDIDMVSSLKSVE